MRLRTYSKNAFGLRLDFPFFSRSSFRADTASLLKAIATLLTIYLLKDAYNGAGRNQRRSWLFEVLCEFAKLFTGIMTENC